MRERFGKMQNPPRPGNQRCFAQTLKRTGVRETKEKTMKTKMHNLAVTVLAAIVALSAFATEAKENIQKECEQAVSRFLKTDPSLKTFINNSAGYAVFPNVGKGGLIVGGAHGDGLLFEKGKVTGEVSMTQASIGAQIGGQTFAEVIFFEDAAAVNNFKGGKYEMSAEISAVAAAEGASQAAKYVQGVAVFTMPKKGLMAQASIGGQKFTFTPVAKQ